MRVAGGWVRDKVCRLIFRSWAKNQKISTSPLITWRENSLFFSSKSIQKISQKRSRVSESPNWTQISVSTWKQPQPRFSTNTSTLSTFAPKPTTKNQGSPPLYSIAHSGKWHSSVWRSQKRFHHQLFVLQHPDLTGWGLHAKRNCWSATENLKNSFGTPGYFQRWPPSSPQMLSLQSQVQFSNPLIHICSIKQQRNPWGLNNKSLKRKDWNRACRNTKSWSFSWRTWRNLEIRFLEYYFRSTRIIGFDQLAPN